MNVEKIFNSLHEDRCNSALGIICQELESQGYSIEINGKEVDSEAIFENKHEELESLTSLVLTLKRVSVIEQRFQIRFSDFHEIEIIGAPNACYLRSNNVLTII
ncbi:hypothetical protein ACFL5S_02130 [Fibrobacterota bacterium]